jgi:hypothetical protein
MFELMRMPRSRKRLVSAVALGVAIVVICLLATDPVSLAFVVGIQRGARRQDFSPQQVQRGDAIVRPGNYIFPDATQLVVRLEPDGHGHAVEYQLSRNEKVLLVSGDDASAMHRWAFTLDDQDRLWFYSADIGLSVWLPIDGEWRETKVVDQPELLRALPAETSLPLGSRLRAELSAAN